MFDIPPGIHAHVPEEKYHTKEIGVCSKTALDQINRTPAHYRTWLEQGSRPTPALEFGAAFHCSLLEPERYPTTFPVQPHFGDLRTNKAKAARDEWEATLQPGARPISTPDGETIQKMVASIRRHPFASKLVADGEPEVAAVWKDGGTGLWCKAKADYYVRSRRFIVDVKTTGDASEHEFARSAAQYRYHVQHAMYATGWAVNGEPIRNFLFIAVEKAPPFAVAIYQLGADEVMHGLDLMRENIETLQKCLATDYWPAYGDRTRILRFPRWAMPSQPVEGQL